MATCRSGIFKLVEVPGATFRSRSSGYWRSWMNWEIYNEKTNSWDRAKKGNYPAASNDVQILAGHTLELEADEEVNNLDLDNTADVQRLIGAAFTLLIYGQLSASQGGAPDPGAGVANWIEPVLVFGGSSRQLTPTGAWGNNANSDQLRLQVTIDDGGAVTPGNAINGTDLDLAGNFTITFTVGTVPDFTGQLTIGQNVIMIAPQVAGPVADLQVYGTVRGSGAGQSWNVAAFDWSQGTLEFLSSDTMPQNVSGPIFSGIGTILITGAIVVTLVSDCQVISLLKISGDGVLTAAGFTLSYMTGAKLWYYNASAKRTTTAAEYPSLNGPDNLVIQEPYDLQLHENKTLAGDLSILLGRLDVRNFTITNKLPYAGL